MSQKITTKISHKDDAQFALSPEVLYLLSWLAQNNTCLEQLIRRAYKQGFDDLIDNLIASDDKEYVFELRHNLFNFFEQCDAIMRKMSVERTKLRAAEQKLLPALDHIDTQTCDDSTIISSLEMTTQQLHKNPSHNGKEVLFKELLKTWQPRNKKSIN